MQYEHWLVSLHGAGIGPARRRALRRRFGSAEGVFHASGQALLQMPQFSAEMVDSIEKSRRKWDGACVTAYEKKGISLVTEQQPQFPARLKKLPGAPDALYYKGHLPAEDVRTVAIVGARMCTEYGREIASRFARVLAADGVQIISGLAGGVDGCAHSGALAAGGATFGVLGCGVDICYPRTHLQMYMQMQEKGGVISEFPPATKPLPQHFPQRNRIISGLADVVLVVEAKEKSGSLITADYALEQGRDVFAVPGRVGDVCSAGCNRLIAQGAGIAWTVDELRRALALPVYEKKSRVSSMRPKKENGVQRSQQLTLPPLTETEKKLFDCLSLKAVRLETIAEKTRLSVPVLLSALLSLQLKGCAQEVKRGWYVKSELY